MELNEITGNTELPPGDWLPANIEGLTAEQLAGVIRMSKILNGMAEVSGAATGSETVAADNVSEHLATTDPDPSPTKTSATTRRPGNGSAGAARPRKATSRPRSAYRRRKERPGDDIVKYYLDDVGEYPLLTKDDEVELAQLIEAGKEAQREIDQMPREAGARFRKLQRTAREGEQAKQVFIQSNLRLVVSIAKKYQDSGMQLLDLIQEGNLGLMHAVEKFDWQKGFKFSTYATWWIRQAITRGIAYTADAIRLSAQTSDLKNRVKKTETILTMRNKGRPPTDQEVAEEASISVEKLEQLKRIDQTEILSLNHVVNEEIGEMEFEAVIEDPRPSVEAHALQDLMCEAVLEALGRLSVEDQKFIKLRFGLNGAGLQTLDTIGAQTGMSREKARKMERRILTELGLLRPDLQEFL